MIITNLKLRIKPGNGGSGSNSFYGLGKITFDGGSGGNGGDIIFKYNNSYNNLDHIINRNIISEDGHNGQRNRRKGKNGKNTIIEIGSSIIKMNTPNDLYLNEYEINEKNTELIIKGGRGGIGSIFSKTNNNEINKGEKSNAYEVIISNYFDTRNILVIDIDFNDNKKYNYIKLLGGYKLHLFKFNKKILKTLNSFPTVVFVYKYNNNKINEVVNKKNYKSNILFLQLDKFNVVYDIIGNEQ